MNINSSFSTKAKGYYTGFTDNPRMERVVKVGMQAWEQGTKAFGAVNDHVFIPISDVGGAIAPIVNLVRAGANLTEKIYSVSSFISNKLPELKWVGALLIPAAAAGLAYKVGTLSYRLFSDKNLEKKVVTGFDLAAIAGGLVSNLSSVVDGSKELVKLSATVSQAVLVASVAGMALSALSLVSQSRQLILSHKLSHTWNKEKDFDQKFEVLFSRKFSVFSKETRDKERKEGKLRSELNISAHIPLFESKFDLKEKLVMARNQARGDKSKQDKLDQMIQKQFTLSKISKWMKITAAVVGIVATILLTFFPPLAVVGWSLIAIGAAITLTAMVCNKVTSVHFLHELDAFNEGTKSESDRIKEQEKELEAFLKKHPALTPQEEMARRRRLRAGQA